MFGTWYITYFLIIFQMESEEGEEMEVARDVVVIPIRDRSEESVSPYSTEDGVTLIKIAKHKKEEHGIEKFFYCDECGESKNSKRKLNDHKRYHKTSECPRCGKAVSLVNMSRHMKTCQGNMFRCDQCDKTTKTSHGLRSHKLKFHEAPRIENKTLLVKGRRRFGETQKPHGVGSIFYFSNDKYVCFP